MCRKKAVRELEVILFGFAQKGERNYDPENKGDPDRDINKLWSQAKAQGLTDEIINAKNDEGDRPLHEACEQGQASVVEWILEQPELGAKNYIDEKAQNGMTPLFLVCLKGYTGAEGVGAKMNRTKENRLKIAKCLVEQGADINAEDSIGMTALHWACYNDDANLVRFLLERKADQKISKAGTMAIDIAGFMGYTDVVKVFLSYG